MGMGIGAAMTGLRPIVEGMNMGFLLLAYNQISNNAGMLHYTSGGQYKAGRLAFLQGVLLQRQSDAAAAPCWSLAQQGSLQTLGGRVTACTHHSQGLQGVLPALKPLAHGVSRAAA